MQVQNINLSKTPNLFSLAFLGFVRYYGSKTTLTTIHREEAAITSGQNAAEWSNKLKLYA